MDSSSDCSVQKVLKERHDNNQPLDDITFAGSLAAVRGRLGILIFIDDYFNCLTVGSVMRLGLHAQP